MSFPTLENIEELEETGRELGRGSYGAVFEVQVHGFPCIAKRLHDILVGRGKEEPVSAEERKAVVAHFRRECELLSGLHHPNVIQFMGVHNGRDEADISLIMEHMHMDLDQCMKTYPNIPLPYKTSILRDVAYGLAYLHSKHVVHRDLNAGNVLLTESFRAKIADLGVSKLYIKKGSRQSITSVCPGALHYMAPECLVLNPNYNNKLDVFSFGHLTIYLVNQKEPVVVPIDDTTENDLMNQQIEIGRRRQALNKMCHLKSIFEQTVQCLQDKADQRPTSKDLVKKTQKICLEYPLPYKNILDVFASSHNDACDKELAEVSSKLDDPLETGLQTTQSLEQEKMIQDLTQEIEDHLKSLDKKVNDHLTEIKENSVEPAQNIQDIEGLLVGFEIQLSEMIVGQQFNESIDRTMDTTQNPRKRQRSDLDEIDGKKKKKKRRNLKDLRRRKKKS